MKSGWKPSPTILSIYFLTSAAGLMLAAIFSTWSGNTSERALLFGLSTQRLALLSAMLIPLAFLAFLGFKTLRNPAFARSLLENAAQNSRPAHWLTWLLALLFMISWLVAWTPLERFGKLFFYFTRLQPLVIWLACASALGLMLLLAARFGLHPSTLKRQILAEKSALWVAGIALVAFALVAVAASQLIVNVKPADEDFWYGAGVPVLPWQVLVALGTGLAFAALGARAWQKAQGRRIPLDAIIFILIWLVAGFLWTREPIRHNFLISKPVGPNSEYYPYADAMWFDWGSQFALIGQGLNNNVVYDRPLYMSMLVAFHALAGQDYERVAALQAALFAVLPALMYLLGKSLGSRGAGLALAILGTLRGLNAMAGATWLNTAMPKHLLTEYPTAIGVAVATLLIISWLKNPRQNWKSALWAGGALGLTALARSHVYGIAFLLLVAVFVVSLPIWKRSLLMTLAVGLALLAGLLPWYGYSLSNQSLGDVFLTRIRNVILERYEATPRPKGTPAGSLLTPAKMAALLPARKPVSVLEFTSANFTHNLVMSAFVLPASPTNYSLEATIKEAETYWASYWDGHLSALGLVFIPLNLVVLALGLAAAFRRRKWAGLVPLSAFLAYHLVNALARTSGGRYLVPVDWVVVLYYVLGWLEILRLLGHAIGRELPAFHDEADPDNPSEEQEKKSFNGQAGQGGIATSRGRIISQGAGIILCIGLIGALIPISSASFAPRYRPLTKPQALNLIQKGGYAPQVDVAAFLKQKNSRVLVGRILYPRYFDMEKGDTTTSSAAMIQGYPRLVFTLLGPAGQKPVILAGSMPALFPNAADGIVLGCAQNQRDPVMALMVILPQENVAYIRAPLSQLRCPFPEPVCDNNRNCK